MRRCLYTKPSPWQKKTDGWDLALCIRAPDACALHEPTRLRCASPKFAHDGSACRYGTLSPLYAARSHVSIGAINPKHGTWGARDLKRTIPDDPGNRFPWLVNQVHDPIRAPIRWHRAAHPSRKRKILEAEARICSVYVRATSTWFWFRYHTMLAQMMQFPHSDGNPVKTQFTF